MIKVKENSVGAWAFLLGLIIAIIIGVFTYFITVPALSRYSAQIYAILVILGLFVGFSIKISGRDSQTFLITGAILVVVSKFGMDSVTGSLIGIGVGDVVSAIFGALLALFVPATIIVAVKTVFSMANV
jgi:hypothetical protein